MKKRVTSLVLLLVMLLSACAPAVENDQQESKNDGSESAQPTETTASEKPKSAYELEIERRGAISDELPEMTFDGANFIVYGGDQLYYYNYAEEYLGETYNDEIYERDQRLEQRFEIDLEIVPDMQGDTSMTIKNTVRADEDAYDLVACQILMMGIDTVSDMFIDMRSVPHIDFDKPWWSSYTNELLTLNNRTFVSVGSFNVSTIAKAKAILYNMDLAEENNLEDIYDIVLDGRWTIDKLTEISTGVYRDLNADGAKDPFDRYGMYWAGGDTSYMLYAFGKTLVELTPEGEVITDRLYDEKLVSIVEKLHDLHFSNADMYYENVLVAAVNHFNSNTVLCYSGKPEEVTWGLLDTDINYAIIPQPKWDEEQELYLTAVDGSSDGLAVLKTEKTLEMTGIVTEALNAETWKKAEYAYYEKILKGRHLGDGRNIQVIDMIMDGRVYDFGYIYGGWSYNTNGGGASGWLDTLFGRYKSKDIASFIEARIEKWDKYINKVADYFKEYQE